MFRRGNVVLQVILSLVVLACLLFIIVINWPATAEDGDPRLPSFVGTYTSPPPAGPWSGASTRIPSGTGISVILPPTSDDGTVGQFLDFPRLQALRLGQASAKLTLSLPFAFNSALIEATEEPLLDQVAATLAANPELYLLLNGHTDLVGEESYNLALGWERAANVYEALRQRGVAAERLYPMSYGEALPLEPVPTPSAANRRVELVPSLSPWAE